MSSVKVLSTQMKGKPTERQAACFQHSGWHTTSFTNFSVANPGKQLKRIAIGIPNRNLIRIAWQLTCSNRAVSKHSSCYFSFFSFFLLWPWGSLHLVLRQKRIFDRFGHSQEYGFKEKWLLVKDRQQVTNSPVCS